MPGVVRERAIGSFAFKEEKVETRLQSAQSPHCLARAERPEGQPGPGTENAQSGAARGDWLGSDADRHRMLELAIAYANGTVATTRMPPSLEAARTRLWATELFTRPA